MSSLDQFSSVFNAAAKVAFQLQPPAIKRALMVSDLEGEAAVKYAESTKGFFTAVDLEWEIVGRDGFKTVKDLLDLTKAKQPDFIVTYRHLHSDAWHWPYSLGEHLDVLIQVTEPPIVIMPHPDRDGIPEHAMRNTDDVMAINTHLAGEDALVNHAVFFTRLGGTLHLTHVEDELALERTLDAISKIPEIDTDVARETLRAQLLDEPSDYIDSCEAVLQEQGVDLKVKKHVTYGRRLEEYRRAVEENKVDLVVLQGHDADQFAMNATAYSLAVELRTTPLLIV